MVTLNELKGWLIATALLVVAGLWTGCATTAAYQAEQAKWQRMADEVTTANHAASIPIRPVTGFNEQYRC
jgi:hypothetical protein